LHYWGALAAWFFDLHYFGAIGFGKFRNARSRRGSFQAAGESALFADSHQQRQFPQALFSFFFATFFFLRASL
jgi:hypothetical protein